MQLLGALVSGLARLATVVGFCAVLLVDAAHAQSPSPYLLASARVPEHLAIEILEHPASFTVTEADAARGHLEPAAPVRLRVRSNAPRGYALQVEASSPQVQHVEVLGPGIAPGAASDGPRERTHELRLRFTLAPGIASGVYGWPVQVQVRPL